MRGKTKSLVAWLILLAMSLALAGCSGAAPAAAAQTAGSPEAVAADGPELPGLTYQRAMEKRYAQQFDVYYYEGGFKYLVIGDGNRYLVVPEGQSAPAGLDPEIKILPQPLDRIYLAGSSTMALFDAMASLDAIRLSSIEQSAWYVESAAAAMERGEILFGGKYSEPDYELLEIEEINLAIENTMILHSPKVIEMIELLGVPVFIDYSSYEPHPLGRTEWVKLFAALINREEAAEAFFDKKVAVMDEIEAFENTGKTVAIFLIDTAGKAQVRSGSDYLAQIIGIAGGVNAFDGGGSAQTNVGMTMEEFYATAVDVDYLIYNASGYSSGVTSLDKLLETSELLADCKAVKNGDIWWIGPETYQHSDQISDLIADIHYMLTGQASDMTFLHHME